MNSITESPQQQNGRHLASIGQIIHSSAHITPGTAHKLLPSLLEAVRVNLGMEVGFISRFKDGYREFLHVSSDGAREVPVPGNSDLLDESACIRVARGQAPNLVHDAQAHPSLSDLPAIGTLGVRSHLSVPIPSGKGDVFGTLCCYSSRYEQELDDRDIGFMWVIAELIGTTLQEEQRIVDYTTNRREYIREVIKADGLQMVWQPIVDTTTGDIIAVEALARFQTDPYRPPNEWFDEAIELGIGTELEQRAFSNGMAIKKHLPDNIHVGCNLSGATFLEPTFREFLRQQDLRHAVLEVTEHDIITDYQALTSSLSEFRSQGLQLAIDDFGAGYASFRHIVELSPEIVKLDITLVRNIDSNPTIKSVVKALVGFAKESGTEILAEGVETQAELDVLISLGVRRVQGYYFHKPMPQAQVLALLRSD